MQLSRKEIEKVAEDRVLLKYRSKMTKLMILYVFLLLTVVLPTTWSAGWIGSWIMILGVVLMLCPYTVVYYYKIKPQAKSMAAKLYEDMLAEENNRPESGDVNAKDS